MQKLSRKGNVAESATGVERLSLENIERIKCRAGLHKIHLMSRNVAFI